MSGSNSALPSSMTTLEAGLSNLRDIVQMDRQTLSDRISELTSRLNVLDLENRRRDAALNKAIQAIRCDLWNVIKWIGAALAITLSAIALKASGVI